MQATLKLENVNNKYCLSVQLNNKFADLSIKSADIVYANDSYNFIIETDIELTKENISIYVNNENCGIETIELLDNSCYRIIFCNNKLFDMIFGLTNIILEINDEIYFSNTLAVAFENSVKYLKCKESIESMLKYILSKEHSFFKTGKHINSNSKNIENHKNVEFSKEIKLLEEIVEIYHRNYSYFLVNPYTKASNLYTVERIEKLSSIDSKTLQYIAENPQNLRFSNVPTGLVFNKLPLTPNKTLVKNITKNIDIYENQQILGFLIYLLNYINDKIKEIGNKINKKSNFELKEKIKDGYDLPINIINLYSNKLYENYHKELNGIRQKLLSLKVKYSKCFPIQAKSIKAIPKLTPIFSEIFHYNNIFSVIKKWFLHGEFKILDSNIVFNFPSADKIYELYSIINLYEYICNTGYKQVSRSKYKYFDGSKYEYETRIENTYRFQKNKDSLFLYYQPVIWNNVDGKNTNGIDLCKVNRKVSYYMPDFIIKKIRNDKVEYSILDSKWRSIKNLKSYSNGFQETIYKYYCSIINMQNYQPVAYLWLLSGKQDGNDKIYFYRNNSICRQNDDYYSRIGIVALNPEDDMIDFKSVMHNIIS